MIGLRIFLHDLEDLFRVQHLLLQRGVGREGRRCNHDALVLLRRELALGTGIEKIDAGQHEESKGRCHGQIVEAVVQPPKIEMAYALESAIDECGEPFLPATRCARRLQQARAHHRRQRQGDDRRYRHRADERERELRKQRAGQTALKRDRHVDGDQHDGHRDDRTAKLSRSLHRCGKPCLALLEMTVDVFDNDNGVVDHESYRKHQRQQRQQIDREAERQHHREGADQGQRDRDHRDDD